MIVAAEENRGPDLPGGHVAEGEESPEETARRESQEETGVKLGVVHFLRAIQSDRYGSAPEDLTYMVIVAALVVEQGPVPPGMKKHVMTVQQFFAAHRGLRTEMVRSSPAAQAKAVAWRMGIFSASAERFMLLFC
jgi:8-oxo-dGTP diphosphatase